MGVISVRVDSILKRRMRRLRDVNWSEVIRDAIRRRLDLEELRRRPVDRRRALEAARRMDEFRAQIGPGTFNGAREIRKWRDRRRRS